MIGVEWDRCGHPRTPANSKRVGARADGSPKLACLTCQRVSTRASQRRTYRAERLGNLEERTQ